MPQFLEKHLENAARARGLKGEAAAHYVYGAENNLGAMHGNKITAKGREMQRKHEAAMSKTKHEPMRRMEIEIHRDKGKKVTGYTVHHQMEPKPHGKSTAFYEDTRVAHPFSADDHAKMISHVSSHLHGQASAASSEEEEEVEGE